MQKLMISKFCKQFYRQPKVAWVIVLLAYELRLLFSRSTRSESYLKQSLCLEVEGGTYDVLKFRFDSAKCNVALKINYKNFKMLIQMFSHILCIIRIKFKKKIFTKRSKI